MADDAGSTASLPTYRIFRDQHGIPQFEPKRGTQALTDALIYAFPTLETELQLMQAALRKFFDSERVSKFVFELRQNDLQTSLAKPKDVEISPIHLGKACLKSWKLPVCQRRGSRASSRTSSRPPSRPPSRALSRVSSRTETPITRPATPFEDDLGGKLTTWVLSSGQEVNGRKKQPYGPLKRRKVAENRGNACDKHRASKTACDPELCPQNKAYTKVVGKVLKDTADLTGGFSGLPTLTETRKNEATNKDVSDASLPPTEGSIAFKNNAPLQHEVDLFWEAPEYFNASLDLHESSLGNLSHSSISTETLSWAETSDYSHSSSLIQASHELHLPLNNIMADVEPVQNFCHLQRYSLSNEDGSQKFPEPSLKFSGQSPSHDIPLLPDKSLFEMHSDDPFMGWGSKRSSQICQDYGWVSVSTLS